MIIHVSTIQLAIIQIYSDLGLDEKNTDCVNCKLQLWLVLAVTGRIFASMTNYYCGVYKPDNGVIMIVILNYKFCQ